LLFQESIEKAPVGRSRIEGGKSRLKNSPCSEQRSILETGKRPNHGLYFPRGRFTRKSVATQSREK